jgi:hypothetical protein
MPVSKALSSTMSSISQLQGTCNTLEKQLFGKLLSLRAAQNTAGADVTEATFGDIEDDLDSLGKAKITDGGNNSAFILTVRTAVSISRT